jgi:protein-S-isoprenylcysteine O-methyltransferase Ste14
VTFDERSSGNHRPSPTPGPCLYRGRLHRCAFQAAPVFSWPAFGSTAAIVSSGIYRFSRNPIYVAFLIVVLATAVAANNAWLLIAIVVLFVLLQFGVVRAEERYLSGKFGEEYDAYRKTTRRWF